MKRAVLALCLFFLPIAALANDVDAAKSLIRDVMKDPESTQFKSVRTVKNSLGENYVCGEVNSKNSYGGYVGFKPFAYKSGKYVIDGSYTSADDLEFFSISSCGGKDLEKMAIIRKQAHNGCKITWEQITDVVLFGNTQEKAADNAITKIKKINPNIPNSQISALRSGFIDSVGKTLSDKAFVQSVKKETKVTERAFMSSCIDNTSKTLSGF
ncbi:hypothetical protein [Enterobacter asburiae]|uniref:hypothetical protein n=1 Tax=Enterobacter asburiae TaxID=61645 RepID=UPI003CEF1F2F